MVGSIREGSSVAIVAELFPKLLSSVRSDLGMEGGGWISDVWDP